MNQRSWSQHHMTARLIDPKGRVHREWRTDRPELALTADRNFLPGWRVVLTNTD